MLIPGVVYVSFCLLVQLLLCVLDLVSLFSMLPLGMCYVVCLYIIIQSGLYFDRI